MRNARAILHIEIVAMNEAVIGTADIDVTQAIEGGLIRPCNTQMLPDIRASWRMREGLMLSAPLVATALFNELMGEQ